MRRRLAASTEPLAADLVLPVHPEPVRAPRLWVPPVGSSAMPIFTVALALRIAVLTVASPFLFHSDFGFGWESGRVARALATGRGFSDPFHGATGPTAWLAPLYPLVLAAIFKAFGIYTRLSNWMALAFNSVCSALTAGLLCRTGRELFGERTGRRAGWAWALSPYAIYWPLRVIWDTNLTTYLLLLVFFLTVRLGRSSSPALVLFPIAYYVTFVTARYRHPIEPEMMLLIVYALSSVEGGVTAWRPRGRPRP